MTFEEQIQVWNVVGTWLSGIATFSAVLVSLHLASRADRVKLKAHAGLRQLFMGDGTPPMDLVEISVTNLGERPVTINTVGWAIGKRKKKRYCIQNPSGPYTAQYPLELAHGKTASFQIFIPENPDWLAYFATTFMATGGEPFSTLVATVNTSVGQTIEVKAEADFIERLTEAATAAATP